MDNRQDPWKLSFELSDVVSQFIADHYGGSPATVAHYEGSVRRALLGYLNGAGVTTLSDVSPAILREYLKAESERTYELKGHVRKLSASTIHSRFEAARTFFNWCANQDYIAANPMDKVRRPDMPRRLRHGYTRDEVKAMLAAAAKGPGWIAVRDRAILIVLIGTGARAAELIGMQRDCIEWQMPTPRPGDIYRGRTMVLHGKGRKDRRVPLDPAAFRALKAYMDVRPPHPSPSIWISQRREPFTQGALNAMMVNLREYSNVPGISPHRFRHTFAAEWYRVNKDLMALMGLLGHAKVETTQRYLRDLGANYGLDLNYKSPSEWLTA